MKFRNNDYVTFIEFEKQDWNDGTAREYIELIKQEPKHLRRYDPKTKQWQVKTTFAEVLMAKRAEKFADRVVEEGFDADKWWSDVEEKNTTD